MIESSSICLVKFSSLAFESACLVTFGNVSSALHHLNVHIIDSHRFMSGNLTRK